MVADEIKSGHSSENSEMALLFLSLKEVVHLR